MSNLKVRKIPFEFGGVRFLWNPANPGFSTVINEISFWVLGLERYFVKAMRDAEPYIRDPEVLKEARLFKEQEAQHSLCHKRHISALIERYPGLENAVDDTIALYDELYAKHDLRYHLAYAADVEATFTPFFKLVIDNRHSLFRDGDSRVASLNLWHFCEEIEHRSSALIVYKEVVGDPWYRLCQCPSVVGHLRQCHKLLIDHFNRHVPAGELCEGFNPVTSPWRNVPWTQQLAAQIGIIRSQMPWHNPEHESLPRWSHKWFECEERGEDMSNFYGRRPDTVSSGEVNKAVRTAQAGRK